MDGTSVDTPWARTVATAGLDWARERLADQDLPDIGTPERVKASAWSIVYRIPTGAGPVWFKASGGDTRYEAALGQALATWAPDRVLTPLAVDAARGWQLLPDGGLPLRACPANTDPRAWERFAVSYAELQRRITPYASELLALGVPDHRPAALPGHFDALLDDPQVALADPQRDALAGLRQRYADACARLAEAGPAPTIQHDDLHSNNVLTGGTTVDSSETGTRSGEIPPGGAGLRRGDESGARFFDWGDASVGHPFTSLLVALRTMAHTFGVGPDDPVVRRFRDAYLEPWGLGRHGRELAALAAWTGTVGRALAWRRALAAAGPADLATYGDAVPGWFTELLVLSPDPEATGAVECGGGHSAVQS